MPSLSVTHEAGGPDRVNTHASDWRQRVFVLGMVASVQFIVLTIIAMFLYPGGTHADHSTTGYSFWSNFFSDLGMTSTFLGDPKAASFVLFTIALSLAGIALCLFFVAVPHLFAKTRAMKRLSVLGSIVGVVSGVSYVGIAFSPSDRYLSLHLGFVEVAFASFLLVVVVYSIAIFLNKEYSNAYAFTYMGFALILGVYLWLLFAGPNIDTAQGVRIQATGQKIVVYAMIVCMFIQMYGAWKTQRGHENVVA
jgi:hypothetical protein